MDKRIKILVTTSNFKTAGSGKVIYDLVSGLDETKFEVELACGQNNGNFFKTIERLGLPIHIFNTKTNYRPYWSLYKRIEPIAKFFKANNYDIVHSWHWSNDWTEAIAARRAGAKWIYTKKAMGFQSKHWKIKSYLANYIITINDEMSGYFPKKRNQKLIPLGIDTDYYSPQHDEKKLVSAEFNIITVANLVPVKGIEVLVKAIKAIGNENVRLTILGANDNDYGRLMKALVKDLRLEQQITFFGKQPDVRPYLAEADLYIIPTLDEGRKEGMPMALVEAMSMGIPILGSNISGIKFVLKEFPDLLFQPANVSDLKDKIETIRAKSIVERCQLGQSLRAYCLRNFTMHQFLNSHEDLYKNLIDINSFDA